ncbi:MAG TPA: signal peptide peptidase SppA [Verrucomicrobiae bacterium]|nr:signal peptide peptidase SppA [Verrucomicrobiae bacterium]
MDNDQTPPAAPPPLRPPPVIAPAPQGDPARRGRGRGWMVLAIVLLALLGLSVLANLRHWAHGVISMGAGHTHLAGPKLDEVLIEDNDASAKLAVIDVNGIITSRMSDQGGYTMVDVVRAELDRAKEDTKVKGVLLRVDSPGGEVLASDEIYRLLTDFQKESGKPVITSMGNLAASGGYYVSSASRWIVANDLTITGSIGVIMHTWNYRTLMNKVGLLPEVYKSGKFKDMLSGERKPEEIPIEERAMVQGLIDETYARFEEVVAEGRDAAHRKNQAQGKVLANNWKDYADGRVFSGSQAYDLGFVDELGNFRDAVKRAKKIAGIAQDANLIQYRQRYDLSDVFRLFGKSKAPVIKVDLGMDIPKLDAGCLYFLCPTFVRGE